MLDTVTITKMEYAQLLKDAEMLSRLKEISTDDLYVSIDRIQETKEWDEFLERVRKI